MLSIWSRPMSPTAFQRANLSTLTVGTTYASSSQWETAIDCTSAEPTRTIPRIGSSMRTSPTCHATPSCRASAWASPSAPTTQRTTPRPSGWSTATPETSPDSIPEPTRSSPRRTPSSSGPTCTTTPRAARSTASRGRSSTTPSGWT
ncbi:unnamed protein product, partial [Callosobruchus maculatus]